MSKIPDELTRYIIGGRTYELIPFLNAERTDAISGTALEEMAKRLEVCGEGDGEYLLANPPTKDEKMALEDAFFDVLTLVFPFWKAPGTLDFITCLKWNREERFNLHYQNPDAPFYNRRVRLVRRVRE